MKNSFIDILKDYFESQDGVVLAFLFGSQGKGLTRPSSDWDIAVYLTPYQWGELETRRTYPNETMIRDTISRLLPAEIDFVILNRARPSLVFSILHTGTQLAIKDIRLYLTLLSRTHYDAVDYWDFVQEYRTLYERAASLTPEARAMLFEHLTFLENEFLDAEILSAITRKEYFEDRNTRRNLERWIENCVMSALDIAKIILASEKRAVPQTYKDMLSEFGVSFVSDTFANDFSEYASLRNILAHEYLDLRWERIENFLHNAPPLYHQFISAVKTYLAKK